MPDVLDAEAIRRWSQAAVAALQAHRTEIDDINVFPVADGDTGSNLALTVGAAAEALTRSTAASAAEALAVLARGAVLGARGNSGVIVSQLLRGMADSAAATTRADGAAGGYGAEQLRAGLAEGVAQAYAAVADPVEGTILTVARAALAGLPAPPAGLAELTDAAVRSAEAALGHTPEQLPALARAGVVDAGGRGLLLLLDALACTVTGGPSLLQPEPEPVRPRPAAHHGVRESGGAEYEYEVQYLLDAPAPATVALRARLSGLGDSVVLAGTGDGTWNVHAHVNDVGAAIEAGVAAGTVHQISVVRFDAEPADPAPPQSAPGGTSAVVAVAPGVALGHLFAREGVSVVEAADGAAVTELDVLTAVRATGAAAVVLLPHSEAAVRAAEAAAARARAAGIRIGIVPTRSPVQALAAVAVHDPVRGFDDDVVAMAEAAAATRFAEICVAREQSLTSVGICEAGDVLGMIDGEVVEIGHGLVSVAFSLVRRLLGVGVELMTVLVGAGAPPGVGALLAEHVRGLAPLTDVTVYLGGQESYPLIIGVE